MSDAAPLSELPLVLRRTLAIALLAFAVGMIWQLILAPLGSLASSQIEWRTLARSAIARDRGWVQSETGWRAEEGRIRQSPIWQRFVAAPPGQSPGVAVQRRVTELLSGIATPEIEAQSTQVQETLLAYPVRVRVTLTVDQLKTFLAGCHSSGPYLRVTKLTVTAPQSQLPQDNPRLQVTLDLVGYGHRGTV